MFSPIASCIFACRNVDKTKNGDVGRSTVALGQTAGLLQEVSKYDGLAANSARSALSVFSKLASQNEFLSTGVTIDCNESLKLKFLGPRLISRIIADQRHNKNKGFRDPCFFMRSVNLHALRSLTPAGFSGNSAIPEDFPCPSPAGR